MGRLPERKEQDKEEGMINMGDCLMTASEAIAYCFKNNYPITRAGLAYTSIKNPDIQLRKLSPNGVQYNYYRTKNLKKLISKSKKSPPAGWIKLSDAYHLARNISHFYSTIKTSNIDIRTYGRRDRYANEKTLRRIFEKCGRHDIKEKIKKLNFPS